MLIPVDTWHWTDVNSSSTAMNHYSIALRNMFINEFYNTIKYTKMIRFKIDTDPSTLNNL